MYSNLIERLTISTEKLEHINSLITNPDMQVMKDFFEVVSRYGTPEQINQKATRASELPNLLKKVQETQPSFLPDLEWLQEQRDQNVFISVPDYRTKVVGSKVEAMPFNDDFAVTLEISACQYFPWAIYPCPQNEGTGS